VPPGAAVKLLERARRILTASDDRVEASADLVAKDLTDWLLVLAWEAFSKAAAESFFEHIDEIARDIARSQWVCCKL
jgi:hypothetical protein